MKLESMRRSPQAAVDDLMGIARRLWSVGAKHESETWVAASESGESQYHCLDSARLLAELFPTEHPLREVFLERLQAARLWKSDDDEVGGTLHYRAMDYSVLLRALSCGEYQDAETQYLIRRNIRRASAVRLTPQLARVFHEFGRRMDEELGREPSGLRPIHVDTLREDLLNSCKMHSEETVTRQLVDPFLDICRSVNLLVPSRRRGHLLLVSDRVDAEFLISAMFGTPTGVPGLDQLFGGHGPIWFEHVAAAGQTRSKLHSPGRVFVLTGRFGTGKSLLAAQIAVSVAKYGGLACVNLMEQRSTDYLYSMAAIGQPVDGEAYHVAGDLAGGDLFLREAQPDGKGALVFFREPKDSLDAFLKNLSRTAGDMGKYPLRLVVIDSFSSVTLGSGPPDADVRAQIHQAFEEVSILGVHLLVIVESQGEGVASLGIEEHLADIVVKLSAKREHQYTKRFIEILKSRYQREQRGEHPFSINPGIGVSVCPSPAAVRARVGNRRAPDPSLSIDLGIGALSKVLGDPLLPGEITVVEDPTGSVGSEIARAFLSGIGKRQRGGERSLLLTVGGPTAPSIAGVSTVTLPRGFTSAGRIFQILDEALALGTATGKPVTRIAIDNLAFIDLDCPYIAADDGFGHVLMDYLHRQVAATLIVSRPIRPEEPSLVRRAVLANSDCHFLVARPPSNRAERELIRCQRSPRGTHKKGWFEVFSDAGGVSLSPTPLLMRFDASGNATAIEVTAYLHAEDELQCEYNTRLVDALKARFQTAITQRAQGEFYLAHAARLVPDLSRDDLQLVQMDEYQLPRPEEQAALKQWWQFGNTEFERKRRGFIRSLWDRARGSQEQHFAVPYYSNVGLLAYDAELEGAQGDIARAAASWSELADWGDQYLSLNPQKVFFEFPRSTDENYNVLFLEILLWLEGDRRSEGDISNPATWLTSGLAIDAAILFARLSAKAFQSELEREKRRTRRRKEAVGPRPAVRPTSKRAVVWRHWFSTLNEMAERLPEDRRLKVTALPGGKSVAGEWFLAIPARSAAREVGMAIISYLTSREAALQRFREGIGLPTRVAFYKGEGAQHVLSFPRAPNVDVAMTREDFFDGIDSSFRRSRIPNYSRLSPVLASSLQRILLKWNSDRSPEGLEKLRKHVVTELAEARAEMAFLAGDADERQSAVFDV